MGAFYGAADSNGGFCGAVFCVLVVTVTAGEILRGVWLLVAGVTAAAERAEPQHD